ncbi:hypothetical protein ACQPZA_26065 [Pseudonocardia xinjiangensis]|uniref:hypothetical protein n=1 Tax=Pseudonocardia xinjiangensis TaxID=75289 RepID=UPI003D926DE7
MTLEVNKNVERLSRYQPFNASSSQLYQENVVDMSSRDALPTQAFDYVTKLIADRQTGVVVLTGDAGHGKTHLCTRVLAGLGLGAENVPAIIRDKCDGESDLRQLPTGRSLRIIKDLSEFAESAPRKLIEALEAADRVTIICANEGKLRSTVQAEPERLAAVREVLEMGTVSGSTTMDSRLHVVNLNYQSVAAHAERSLTAHLLRYWGQDQRKWRSCAPCDARDICPIYENHRLLSQGREGEERRNGVVQLMKIVEHTGQVVTIRELLIVIALAITGGLRCRDVHAHYHASKTSTHWQYRHIFHQAIFGETITAKQQAQVRLIAALKRVDPGRTALRGVDDYLVPEADEILGRFLPPDSAAVEETPRSRVQSRRDADRQRRAFLFLRRRDFFFSGTVESGITRAERAGIKFASQFSLAASDDVAETQLVGLRDELLRGLEAIQGIRRSRQANFLVVDPAFTSHRSRASVIARQFTSSRVRIHAQSDWWRQRSGEAASIPHSVDWLDRSVYLVFSNANGEVALAIELDMHRVELILRYAEGLTARRHFHADIRNLSAQLAHLSSVSNDDGEIMVLVDGERRKLAIDVGNRIRAVEI